MLNWFGIKDWIVVEVRGLGWKSMKDRCSVLSHWKSTSTEQTRLLVTYEPKGQWNLCQNIHMQNYVVHVSVRAEHHGTYGSNHKGNVNLSRRIMYQPLPFPLKNHIGRLATL